METKVLIELLRHTAKSGYKEFLMHNRMLMQCYTIDEDADIGLHYILHIPADEKYSDVFFDDTLYIIPADIISVYREGHQIFLEKKKELKAKPKDCREEVLYDKTDKKATLTFISLIHDEVVDKRVYTMPYPVNEHSSKVETIVNCYNNIFQRLKTGGYAVTLDGFKYGLYHLIDENEELQYFKIKVAGTKIKIPLYKNLLAGSKEPDEFFISIQETNIDGIYLYTVQTARKGLITQYIGYIQNF